MMHKTVSVFIVQSLPVGGEELLFGGDLRHAENCF